MNSVVKEVEITKKKRLVCYNTLYLYIEMKCVDTK